MLESDFLKYLMLPAGELIFLFTAGAVFFSVLMIYNILNRAVEEYQKKYVVKSVDQFSEMFLFIDARQLFMLQIAITALAMLLGILFLGLFSMVILGIFGWFFPQIVVQYYRKFRIKKFETQLVDALIAMSNAFKAGLTMQQAMEGVAREAGPPLSQEFMLTLNEIKLGVTMEDALVNMAKRVGSDDLELTVTSTNIARSLGGNMAEMFDIISTTIRERFRLEGKIDSITSQGKLQGWIVGMMPLALWLVLQYMRPDLTEPMTKHLFGYLMFGAIAVLEFVGMMWIRRIVNVDI
ncbi:MAG: hypothetical protein GMKNLPBB_00189 [Myxococcota bacterium]|nr:hypothetical protein [Myxococcota bacterium]